MSECEILVECVRVCMCVLFVYDWDREMYKNDWKKKFQQPGKRSQNGVWLDCFYRECWESSSQATEINIEIIIAHKNTTQIKIEMENVNDLTDRNRLNRAKVFLIELFVSLFLLLSAEIFPFYISLVEFHAFFCLVSTIKKNSIVSYFAVWQLVLLMSLLTHQIHLLLLFCFIKWLQFQLLNETKESNKNKKTRRKNNCL